MKTTILAATVLLATSSLSVLAQSGSSSKNSLHFGARVGVNVSNIIRDNQNGNTSGAKAGLNAAAFLEIPLASVVSFQPEIQFSQKGFKSTGSFLGSPYEYRQTTNFVEVPLLIKIKPSKNFGVVVGPQFSYLASTNTKFTTNNAMYESEVKTDNDNLKKNILGGVIGLEASGDHVVVGLRYNLDFQNNNGDGTSSNPRYKNQVLALSIGFRL